MLKVNSFLLLGSWFNLSSCAGEGRIYAASFVYHPESFSGRCFCFSAPVKECVGFISSIPAARGASMGYLTLPNATATSYSLYNWVYELKKKQSGTAMECPRSDRRPVSFIRLPDGSEHEQ